MHVFSLVKLFFSFTGSGKHERKESQSLENCHFKIQSEPQFENGKKNFLDPNPKKMNSNPQHCLP
jgi:hypothetical protein